jgi:predicted metal-dependent hydrolase
MRKGEQISRLEDIEFRIVYSRRRTLGISVLPDSSVLVRAPYHASLSTISRVVREKSAWIIRHRDNYRNREQKPLNGLLTDGSTQLFRGEKCLLRITEDSRPFIKFQDGIIEMALPDPDDLSAVRKLLYAGFKKESSKVFPEMVSDALRKYEKHTFRPTGLTIRSMKSRWGSCSKKGMITLSTELIKLPDYHIQYVIAHELCHLKHHNHGKEYYNLLTELFPGWKKVRKELREYVH